MADPAASRFARPPASERVLEVADELFYCEGINTVGVDRIAAEADASKATLYAHYGNKDGLVAAYLDRRTRLSREGMSELAEAADRDARERLLSLFEALGAWYGADDFRGCPFINSGGELSDPDHPGHQIGRRHRDWVKALLAKLAAEAGADDPESLAVQLLMLYDGATVSAYLDRIPNAAETARDAADRLIASAVDI